jgi:hypothetical protein
MKKLVLETTSPFQGLPELVVRSCGMLDKADSPLALVNMDVQQRAHMAAE